MIRDCHWHMTNLLSFQAGRTLGRKQRVNTSGRSNSHMPTVSFLCPVAFTTGTYLSLWQTTVPLHSLPSSNTPFLLFISSADFPPVHLPPSFQSQICLELPPALEELPFKVSSDLMLLRPNPKLQSVLVPTSPLHQAESALESIFLGFHTTLSAFLTFPFFIFIPLDSEEECWSEVWILSSCLLHSP